MELAIETMDLMKNIYYSANRSLVAGLRVKDATSELWPLAERKLWNGIHSFPSFKKRWEILTSWVSYFSAVFIQKFLYRLCFLILPHFYTVVSSFFQNFLKFFIIFLLWHEKSIKYTWSFVSTIVLEEICFLWFGNQLVTVS